MVGDGVSDIVGGSGRSRSLHGCDINVGLVRTNDGATCILCDSELPHPPQEIHFLEDSYTVRIVYNMKNNLAKDLSYPLEHDIVDIWKRRGATYFAYIINGEVRDIFELPIRFVEEE